MIDYENLTRSDIVDLINERIIGRNGERNRKILYRRLIDGILFEQLAEEFDLSTTQVKNIVYKGCKRLYK